MIEYTVHSCVTEPVAVRARLGDREIDATVPGLVVELVDGTTHGHTFRLVPADDEDMASKRELFTPGNRVRATFEGIGE